MEYTINVEPDIKPEQIKIRKVTGTLQREISPANKNGIYAYKNYTTYYVFEIPVLNYTLVNLESGERFNNSMKPFSSAYPKNVCFNPSTFFIY
jgi:hypothetical protein